MNVFLTVDVECYRGDYAREVDGLGEGLPYMLGVLRRAGLPATFFVEALGATRWGDGPLRAMCGALLADGHDVQLHLHPVVARLDGFRDDGDVLCLHGRAVQGRLIRTGLEILSRVGARPSCFRAGDLAADAATLEAMAEHGLATGSNRDLDRKSSIRSRIEELFPFPNDLAEARGIRDLPVSVVRSPIPALDGPYRHLQITAMGAGELVAALERLKAAGTSCATILIHPQEFFDVRGDAIVPNGKNRARFERLARELAAGRLGAVTTVRALGALALPARAPAIPRGSLLLAAVRVVQQAAARCRAGVPPILRRAGGAGGAARP